VQRLLALAKRLVEESHEGRIERLLGMSRSTADKYYRESHEGRIERLR